MTKNRVILFALLAVVVVSVEEYRISKQKREAAADHVKMFQALTDSNQQQQSLLQNALKLKEVYKLQEMAMAYAQGRAEERLHRPFDGQFRYLLDHPYVPEERGPK
jgi:hypothetical protein